MIYLNYKLSYNLSFCFTEYRMTSLGIAPHAITNKVHFISYLPNFFYFLGFRVFVLVFYVLFLCISMYSMLL